MRKNIPVIIFTVILAIGFTSYDVKSHLKKMTVNTGIKYLTKLAEQGDARAQTDLGLIYGNGSTQDYTKHSIGIIRQHNKIMRQHNLTLGCSMKTVGLGLEILNLQEIFIIKRQSKVL